MNSGLFRPCLLAAALAAFVGVPGAWAQSAQEPIAPCGEPAKLPPANSPALVRCIELRFHPVNETILDTQTYLFRLKTAPSRPSEDKWVPFDESVTEGDFWSLWQTNFLDNLWIETYDEPFANGVVGKHIVYNMEERSRIKAVDYQPAGGDDHLKVEVSKIEEKLKDQSIELRLDSFVDESTIRRVKGVVHDLYAEQGYNDATVATTMTPLEGQLKLVKLTFHIDPGPMVRIRAITFDGNTAFKDDVLRDQFKDNKQKTWYSFLTDSGIFHEAKFSDDAERLGEFYRNNGYAAIQVGAPQTEVLETSKDGETAWIRVHVPVEEGMKYKVGTFQIVGDTAIKKDALLSVFKIHEGEDYDLKKLRKGFEKLKEIYGAYGYWQWQPDPTLKPRGIDPATGQPAGPDPPPPIMDIDLRMNEGKQFFVNRITFVGNTNTHDSVIRRELRVAEGGIFNGEALKDSVRRINQLGYFKPLEGKEGDMDVVPTPDSDNKVDIKVKVQEQNRNQISFGAGISQFEGVFGQLSYQTTNFLGRGESAGVSLQKGSQARQYQVSFSEPYLFDRPITVGTDLQATQFIFPAQFTQDTRGGTALVGLPVRNYTRFFLGYSYQDIRVENINPLYLTPQTLAASPYLRDSLLIDTGGERRVGKISPSIVFNTVNQPIFPTAGSRVSLGFDFAGAGGNTQYVSASLEGTWFHPLTQRMSFGLHAQTQYIRPYGNTTTLPIFEKLFSGGEYTVRGFDIRSISPRDPASGVLVGGNKIITLNAEYYINVVSQARIVLFYDAGQVKDVGQPFAWKEPVLGTISPGVPFLSDPFALTNFLTAVNAVHTVILGQTSAFHTSTGIEVRFLMPVLNVPFRLISSYNPQRLGILNNNGVQTPRFTFRFAVGTTF